MNAPLDHTHVSLTISQRLGRPVDSNGVSQVSLKKPYENKRETMTYRQFFARRWSQFIRENFVDAAHVAVTFGVTVVTAQNWIDGMNAPQGWAVARVMTDPDLSDEAMRHMGGHS